jgi:hypothetical protein
LPILSWCMTYHRNVNMSSSLVASSGIGNYSPFRSTCVHPVFKWDSQFFVFSFQCSIVSPIVTFFWFIVLSVLLWITASDCPICIFKLFVYEYVNIAKWVHPRFLSGVSVTRSLVLCLFCRSLFVLLYFFFWPLCCLFFFDIQILIAPLVSSNSSYWGGFKQQSLTHV